ncbi:MAG: ParA family protein [Acidobacteriaceae bacterium]|nr:ParA family protein [Acidobacteriaceae bacterium]
MLTAYNMVMIVTFCNGKGGTGKTTLSVLLGLALKEAGHGVAIYDIDPQKTATRWVQEVGGIELGDVDKAPVTIVDTPPRLDSPQTLAALRKADLIVLVTSPSPADLFTSRDTAALLKREGLINRAHLLYNQVEQGTILSRDLSQMAQKIGMPSLSNHLQRRQAYQHAVLLGWKSLGAKAREEALRVALEIVALSRTRTEAAKKNRVAV